MKEKDKSEEDIEHLYGLGMRALDFLRSAEVTMAWISSETEEHLHLEFYAPLKFRHQLKFGKPHDSFISTDPDVMWYNCLNLKPHPIDTNKKDSVCEFVDFLIDPSNYYLIDYYDSEFWKKLQPLMEVRSLSELELKLAIAGF